MGSACIPNVVGLWTQACKYIGLGQIDFSTETTNVKGEGHETRRQLQQTHSYPCESRSLFLSRLLIS